MSAHSPTQVAKVPPFLSINPAMFESSEHWTYRDLQKLARRLEIPAGGKREDLVERLRSWHRDERITGQAGAFHSVEVRASVEGKPISPRLLSPLVAAPPSPVRKPSSFKCGSGSETERSPMKPITPRGNVLFSPVRRRAPPRGTSAS